jgi:hypothetical protein
MNNTTTIRTLTATTIVVVLIFTAGSLIATATSSSTPLLAVFAYQNKGTQYNGNDNNNGNTLTDQASIQATRESGFDNGLGQESQNVICIHPGNNATCSQGGIISNTTQILLPTPQPQPSAILTIIKHVINDIVGTISAKDFTSSASGTNVSPQSSFPGAQSPGTTVTLKPGTFSVALLQQANATTIAAVVADHNNCSSGDIITCTHKETHHSAKDTTPFVLPIPFP